MGGEEAMTLTILEYLVCGALLAAIIPMIGWLTWAIYQTLKVMIEVYFGYLIEEDKDNDHS